MTPNELQQLADKLPEGVTWGAPLTPEIAQHLAQSPENTKKTPESIQVAGDMHRPVLLSDDEIESVLTDAGFRWTGDWWKCEDADLYPAIRAIMDACGAKDAGPLVSALRVLLDASLRYKLEESDLCVEAAQAELAKWEGK